MVLLGPRPLILGVSHLELTSARQYWTRTIPPGAPWRLEFLTLNYYRSTDAEYGTPVQSGNLEQVSPDLSYTLFDSRGQAFSPKSVFAPQVTTPAGGFTASATSHIGESYSGNDTLKILIEGGAAVNGPFWISMSFFGIRGWETMGGR